MDPDAKPIANSEVAAEPMGDELLLYHPGSARSVCLNASAALVWNCCDGQRTAAEIAALLGAQYPAAAAEIARDVPETLQRLLELDVIALKRT
jgi:hypothetical protein